MKGIYTSSRDLSRLEPIRITAKSSATGITSVSESFVQIPGHQVTTSYRTSGPEQEYVGPEDKTPGLNFPVGDNGHPFDTLKLECRAPKRRVVSGTRQRPGSSITFAIGGYGVPLLNWDILPNPSKRPYRNFADIPSLSQGETNRLGSSYILATAPTAPQANLLLTLTELAREGLPAIPGVTTLKDKLTAKNLGGESLNYQFGIAPLISDLQSIARAVVEAPKILEQFRADSGKVVTRRRKTVYDPASVITERNLANYSRLRFAGESAKYSASGYLEDAFGDPYRTQATECHDRTFVTTSFVGAYQYHLDVGDDAIAKLKSFEAQANQLLGIRVTPELLWNLAPWSWLSDWFMNIGDILGNASRFMSDGLVLKYGYLMRHTVTNRYLTYIPSELSASAGSTWITRYHSERKERVPATPFGFGADMSSLTGYQTGIVASLAAARTPDRSPRSPRR